MQKKENNFAYIDGENLHEGIRSLGWILDYKRFRIWLSEKYSIRTAYLFIGLIPKYKELYKHLQESGFTLVFKEVIYDDGGKPKGNCDADLVLQATRDIYENKFDNALIVASDGDYSGLVRFFLERNKLISILSPSSEEKCSILIKRTGVKIVYLKDHHFKLRLSSKEKTPDKDGTL